MKTLVKYIFVIALAIFGLSSCFKETDPVMPKVETGDDAPAGEVTIDFRLGLREIEAALVTKADTRDSIPHLQTLHVAVFGSSGYLKQYAEAALVETPTTSGKENYYGPEDKFYTYRVTLWLTNSSIKVHFIGNGPSTLRFDYESSCIPELYTSVMSEYSDAYWQRITIPRGIRAKTYSGPDKTDGNGQILREGDYINIEGNKITNGQGYLAAQETIDAMSEVQLIRNFAQLSVESLDSSISFFDLESYSIVNEPNQGTIAPYNGEWIDYLDYIDNGNTNAYSDLLSVYKGLSVASTTYDSSYPEASAFSSNPLGANVIAAGDVGYIYERPAPALNQPPTYLLVYGTYKKPGDPHYNQKCYYKIDLMDKGQYLTLFRNFRYKVTIKHVNKFGKTTPKSAADGAGSGDVSADAEAISLTDISDGDCQLYVSEMRPILVEKYENFGYTGLSYKFVYNVSTTGGNQIGDDAVDNNYYASDQQATIVNQNDNAGTRGGVGKPISMSFYRVVDGSLIPFAPHSAGGGDVIDKFKLDTLPQPASSNYYRNIYFTTKAPTGATKSETFRIKAEYTTGSGETERTHTLYRDIVFTLLQTQLLSVQCIPDDVKQEAGQKVTVRITIPSGLPQAMFPLQFPIEIANRSLGPDYEYTTQNLPVTYGQTYQYTEQGGQKVRGDKNGYYFVRSLSLDEYKTSLNSETNKVEFDTYFITTKDQSASEVYVGCFPPSGKQYSYFEPNKTEFSDYVLRNFTWLTTNYNAERFWSTGTDVTLEFRMDTADIPLDNQGNPDVYVTLASTLSPAENGSNLGETSTPNRYKLSSIDTTSGRATIKVHVNEVGGNMLAKVTLEARHYNTNEQCQGTTFEIVKVSSIAVSPSSVSLEIGSTRNLTANVQPADATDRSVTWSSSNTAVATVNSSGVVTAVSVGTATIRARANDGSDKVGTCSVTVTPVAVTGVSLDITSIQMIVGTADVTLTATVNPNNATNKNVSWESDNTSVASVDANGKVHAVASGTAIITVTTEDGGFTASCTVTVRRRAVFTPSNANGYARGENEKTSGDVTLYFSDLYRAESGSNYVRPNTNSTIRLSVPNGNTIKSVIITFSGNNYTYDYAPTGGTHTLSGTTWTWTGDQRTVQMTSPNNSRRITNIEVLY